MSPTVLRRSGPDVERDGRIVTPRAMVSTCEVCGSELAHAHYETSKGYLSYCRDHDPASKERNVA